MSFYFDNGSNNLILKSTLFRELSVRHAFGTRGDDGGGPPAGCAGSPRGDEDPGRPPVIGDGVELPGAAAAWLRQVHSCRVVIVRRTPAGIEPLQPSGGPVILEYPPPADALVSGESGLWLSVQTADCLPVLFFAPGRGVAAAAHSGWRGTLGEITARTVRVMVEEFGAAAGDIRAAVGPGIRGCCYRVGEELASQFEARFPGSVVSPGPNPRLDLALCVRRTLEEAGLRPDHIEVCPLCTCCGPALFHSYRRDGEGAGRLYSGIMGTGVQDVGRL
jgi:YfiH family protein